MSLDRYRRKRDFGRTPEPPGRTPEPPGRTPEPPGRTPEPPGRTPEPAGRVPEPAGRVPEPPGRTPGEAVDAPHTATAVPTGSRRFVVQRHRATRLHYDFRLEIDGVLMSWAVPRGPSLRALERRMAARTEDHPLEYFDFEGVIPRGEYGGGDVIVWDWGTWEPEPGTPDPGAAVRDGELKLVLHGERLRGRFVLVRTRSNDPRKEDWLLIHKRDAEAREDWDIDAYPTSVKSGRTNDEVKRGLPAVWISSAPASTAAIDLSAAREVPMPDFIPPMSATPVDGAFDDGDWLFELKLDGYRVQAVVRDGSVRLWTRNRLDAARYFPELAASRPTWISAAEAIVDGEVVALDEDGRPDFSLLQDRTGVKRGAGRRGASGSRALAPLVFHAFDLLHLDGRSLLDVPLEERKKLLRSVVRDGSQARYLTHIEAAGRDFLDAVAGQDLEGVVAKLRRSRYEPGRRSRAWLKIKVRREQELVVVGYEPGSGTHAELGSLLVATHEDGAYRFAGEVGSGLDARTRRTLRRQLDAIRVEAPPPADPPRLPAARWVEPRIVIRAEFSEWTGDGLLRQSAYKGLEPDRDPRSVTRERPEPAGTARDRAERAIARRGRTVARDQRAVARGEAARGEAARDQVGAARDQVGAARDQVGAARDQIGAARDQVGAARDQVGALPGATIEPTPDASDRPARSATPAELEALDRLGANGTWEVGGHAVRLTNLDKVLFPGPGYTKRDLVRYYATIAPVLLPYLRDRPLNTDRWPDGVTGHHFWQKQIPAHAPAWVARWDYPEAGHDQSHTYVVADRVAAMAWLANQAVIDLHPWTSRLPDYDRPTCALIDLDPGPRTTWEELLTLARLNHTALEHLGVIGFPKVTGKRGIQVWIPIVPKYTFDQTRDWVGALSGAVGAIVPDLVSWEWGKADRGGRARLDFTQNAVNKTLVAPYAVRPVAGATVSAPISWEELDDPALRPDRWDIRTILARVEERGDLFRGVLELEQELPPLS